MPTRSVFLVMVHARTADGYDAAGHPSRAFESERLACSHVAGRLQLFAEHGERPPRFTVTRIELRRSL